MMVLAWIGANLSISPTKIIDALAYNEVYVAASQWSDVIEGFRQ